MTTLSAAGQWKIQDTHTTASLRGIHSLGNGIAWASGTGGTVLRTKDGGATWEHCATPPDAEKLDFRGVQGFDATTAIVMSSGKGDLSRLYKTIDGCQTWKLVATNPDKDGFWDSIKAYNDLDGELAGDRALILGDTVEGQIKLWEWREGWEERELELEYQIAGRGKGVPGESSFAASNSVLQVADTPQIDKTWKYDFRWVSGTARHTFMSYVRDENTATCEPCRVELGRVEVPMAGGTESAGIFSFSFRTDFVGIAVGGDYTKPDAPENSAAITSDGGITWKPPLSYPHGYRSAVAYDEKSKIWIAVGTNGTDVSVDDGHNWRALKPEPNDAPDADRNWNALSLPFVVGAHGRIGVLRPDALKAPK